MNTNGHPGKGYNPLGLDPYEKPVDPRPLALAVEDRSLVIGGGEARRYGLSTGEPVAVPRILPRAV
jgi:hypothetical protein